MSKSKTTSLMTELERQQKYLDELPDNFEFPLFNTKRAVESQRRSGYRNTASAAREIVDNSIEAGATKIHVIFEVIREKRKHAREVVNSVAFIDNAAGMKPKMARFALTWGGGTHFDDPNFIGKFGFGLPNASINQTRVTEVYTRTSKKEKFTRAVLDIRQETLADHSKTVIAEPKHAELPAFVQNYLDELDEDLAHGTVVVWRNPDRLSYRTPASLREHLIQDFGVTYRYLLEDVEMVVAGLSVEAVDPLFTTPGALYYLPPDEGGAKVSHETAIPVKYFIDEETGARHLERVENSSDIDVKNLNLLAVGTINVKIVRFPVGFAIGIKKHDPEGTAFKRFEIRKTRRGMSFVRAGREIETVDVFPRSQRDQANGLGKWPLLQTFAYHWGIEVSFDPALDEPLGIANDKQSVRPSEDFWRVLTEAEIDRLAREENTWQADQRKGAPDAEPSDEPTPAEQAAAAAETGTGKKTTVPDADKPAAKKAQQKKAEEIAKVTKESVDVVLAALEKEAARRKFKIDYFDSEDGPFYKPTWEGTMVVVLINRKHAFYQVLYGELLKLKGAKLAKEAVDVLLLALAKAEITSTDEVREWYQTQRIDEWSRFLRRALTTLAQNIGGSDDEGETAEDGFHNDPADGAATEDEDADAA